MSRDKRRWFWRKVVRASWEAGECQICRRLKPMKTLYGFRMHVSRVHETGPRL